MSFNKPKELINADLLLAPVNSSPGTFTLLGRVNFMPDGAMALGIKPSWLVVFLKKDFLILYLFVALGFCVDKSIAGIAIPGAMLL